MNNEKMYQVDQKRFIHRAVTGNHLLIPIGTAIAEFSGYIEINESAAFIFDSLKEAKTRHELTELVKNQFGLDDKTAKADTEEFLEEMLTYRMAKEM